jgi:hypothetical protein
VPRRRFNSGRFHFFSRRPLHRLEIAVAARVPAVAVDLRDIACPFAVGAAIIGIIINSTIAGRILTRSHIFIVGHLALLIWNFIAGE